MKKILVLDAMGVIYESGDDVPELLIPFVRAHNGTSDAQAVQDAYFEASMGSLSSEDLWRRIGLDPGLEDEYLAAHRLTDGLLDFLPIASESFRAIMCLSNDVSELSLKLRRRFGLERFISHWFISGDLKVRKPSPEIYRHLLDTTGIDPRELVFVDDRLRNLGPARSFGITAVLFDPGGCCEGTEFPIARSFSDILTYA